MPHWVFGSERYGLPNEVIERCNVLINIPSNPDYSSLNLAQAVQVLAYECRLAELGDHLPETEIGFRGTCGQRRADRRHVCASGRGADCDQFLACREPEKQLMSRLRRLFARTSLEEEEVNILRGVAKQILWKQKTPAED